MKRRQFLASSGLAAAALAFPAIARAQNKRFADVTLRINGYGGDYDRLMTELISRPLEQKYGLKVTYTPGSSAAAVTRVLASPDNPPFDILLCDSPSIPELLRANATTPITKAEVPGIARLLPGIPEFGEYGLPFALSSLALAYNTQRVKEPLKAYADLARPDLKDRVGLFNPENSGGVLQLLALAESNGGSVDNIAPAFAALKKMKANIAATTPSTVNLVQLFEQEEVWAGGLWDGRIHALRKAGKPIAIVTPEEGIYAVRSYMVPVKTSKHPEAVRAFLEQATSDEFIGGIASFFRYGPTTDVKLPDDVTNGMLTYGEEAVKRIKPIDWAKVAANRGAWLNQFSREMR